MNIIAIEPSVLVELMCCEGEVVSVGYDPKMNKTGALELELSDGSTEYIGFEDIELPVGDKIKYLDTILDRDIYDLYEGFECAVIEKGKIVLEFSFEEREPYPDEPEIHD